MFLSSAPGSPEPHAVESITAVMLAVLLCIVVCIAFLDVLRFNAWMREFNAEGGAAGARATNKGLKKKVLKSLPKLSYAAAVATAAGNGILAECLVCLAEFVKEDEIRILPQCGHGFHVACVDTWFQSHSSCPTCRQRVVVAGLGAGDPPARCHPYGAISSTAAEEGGASSSAAAAEEGGASSSVAAAEKGGASSSAAAEGVAKARDRSTSF